MSTTKTFTNIKSGKRHQIDATARGYYDFRTTVVPQPNKPLSYNMKVYDGLNYAVDLSKNSVRPGEINFDGTVLPYIENNTLTKTNYCFGNSGTNYDLPVYNKEYVNINKIGDFDIGDGVVSNFYRDHYLTVTLPNYSSGSVNSFEILTKVHTPTNNTSNARILNSTDSYDNLALDLGTAPGFNFCGDTIGFGSQFDADIDLWVKVQFDGTNLSLHHSLNGVDYIQDNSKSWSKSNVWFTSNTYSLGLRSYDFVNVCFFNGTIDLNECYVKINDEIINFGENSLNLKYNDYSLVGNAKINNGICSDFDSSSRVLLNAINFTSEKDIIIGFTTSSDVTTAQKIFEYQNDGISFQIIDGMIQYWTKNNTLWNDYDVVEPNNSYKLKITITSNTSYTLGFMNMNNASYNNIEVTDTGLTIGKNLSFSIGNNLGSLTKPFLGTIDIKNIPGAIQTESKVGIFQDYEDNGKAKTLNAFSSNNELVVLSPNENIVDYTWLGTVNIPKHIINWGQLNDWYNWTSQVNELGEWVETAIPANGHYKGVAYGNGKYVAITEYYPNDSTAKYIYSEDGINWVDGVRLERQKYWYTLNYLNDRFITLTTNDNYIGYSEDGINWRYSTLPATMYWWDITYGNGKYVIVGTYNTTSGSNKYAYSEDGINWTQGTLPATLMLYSITFGKGKFVAPSEKSNKYAYSEDGINWTQGTLPTSFSSSKICYGNEKFIIYNSSSPIYVYSEDGINWTQGTLPASDISGLKRIVYGDGIFVAYDWTTGKYAYSKDGINWTIKDFSQYKDKFLWMCYGNGKFVAIDGEFKTTKASYLPVTSQELSVYTSKEKPTIDSLVYSNPNVESELTITNVGENNITLSDNNVYVRNPSGDTSTSKPSVPDTPTIDPSTLKFGDRIDNKATVVGTFESSDLGTVAFAVLDAQYRGTNIAWSTNLGINRIDTGLPNYSSVPTEQNKESATYNTNYILNNYSAVEAFTFCRNIESLRFDDKQYNCQLPNCYELQQIYNKKSELDALDPTAEANSTKKLSNWGFGSQYALVWSSNEYDSERSWLIDSSGLGKYSNKNNDTYGVCLIIEIKLS